MSEPVVFISHFTVKEGKLDDLRRLSAEVEAQLRADKPETVAERLKVYARDTAPLVDYYGAQGKLVGIDATGPVEDVTVRAIDGLRSYGG